MMPWLEKTRELQIMKTEGVEKNERNSSSPFPKNNRSSFVAAVQKRLILPYVLILFLLFSSRILGGFAYSQIHFRLEL